MNEKDIRKLKVYATGDQAKPQIILQGKWLADCGFSTGDFIMVACEDNKLTITKGGRKVAVVGSRGIRHIELSTYLPADCCLIISGGAKGVDTLAEQYAKAHGIETLIIRPDYSRYGRSAPIRRNDSIVDYADMVLAFWDGKSRGTKYSIEYAKKIGKPVKVIEINEQIL